MRILPPAIAGAAALAATALLAPSGRAEAGSEQFQAGQAVYAEACAVCHGETGRGGPGYANPIWGERAQLSKFGNAAGLFEYHQLMMPFDDPTRVDDAAKWAVTLYVLANHGTLSPQDRLGEDNAAGVAIR